MISYRANDFIKTQAELKTLLARLLAYEELSEDEKRGTPIPFASVKILEIYNGGDIREYEFLEETVVDYTDQVSAQAELDIASGNFTPYENDPELWLDAILRPCREKLFERYDYLQGACCWPLLTEVQKNEFRAWRTAMRALPEKYPTFVNPSDLDWPSFSFMDTCYV